MAATTMNEYGWRSYVTVDRWASYWHQIDNVRGLAPRTCLVVGVGDRVVPLMLAEAGIEVTTLDIDPKLDPDVVADVRKLPFQAGAFDVVLCAEVLEHLPFADFDTALSELARVGDSAVVSVPRAGLVWQAIVRVPGVGRVSLGGTLPSIRHRVHAGHEWEFGSPGTRSRGVMAAVRRHFAVERTYTLPQNPYHRMHLLRSLPSLGRSEGQPAGNRADAVLVGAPRRKADIA